VNAKFEQGVVDLIGSSNIFLAQRVLKAIEPRYLYDAERQRWLGQLFVNANYRLQLAMLEKLKGIPLKQDLRDVLEKHRRDFNEEIAIKIEQLLKNKNYE